MENKEVKREKRSLSALDVFIVILVLLCLAGLALRVALGRDGSLPEDSPKTGEFALTFEIPSLKAQSGSDISAGDVLYTEDGAVFGTLTSQLSVTPARIYSEDADGKYVLSYSSGEGDGALVDVTGVMTVTGYQTGYGFLAGGKTLASPGCEIALHTDRLTFTVRVTDVARVSD